jgi:hypothetical protein
VKADSEIVWVPAPMRPPRQRLWRLADRTTWGFGTWLAKPEKQPHDPAPVWRRCFSAIWRVPADIPAWFGLAGHRTNVATYGHAHVQVSELTERRGRNAEWLQRWGPAVLGVEVAVVVGLLGWAFVLGGVITKFVIAAFVVFFVVMGIETGNTGWAAMRRGARRREGLAEVRQLGHRGPVGFAGVYVCRPEGDGHELLRRWTEHLDTVGIALVIEARTKKLANRYASKNDFVVLDATVPALMYRLPQANPSSREGGTSGDRLGERSAG